ncbi:hypothetical protein [Longimicrobium sp.]|uniref:hypothetical protein n=1 Tax=Longimicrobium sp. TaxID=2029185 RepID=UPI002E30CA71|nr:hypothetical protein [Longimicrobium sp.]HEX6038098.1 hypothetical protein [Longimicrobium sp.]
MSRPPRRPGRVCEAAPWAVLVLFIPAAFLGMVMQANEYRGWGGGGVDCDGPALLAFAVPALVVYGLLALVFARSAVRRRAWVPGLAALVCAALLAPLWSNVREARAEERDPAYLEVCEGR